MPFLCIVLLVICFAECTQSGRDEILRKHTVHFGSSKNFTVVDELIGSKTLKPFRGTFFNDGSGKYSFRINVPELLRYEVDELKNPGTDTEIPTVKGLHTERLYACGLMFFIRTLGSKADQNSFQPFVISIKLEPVTPQTTAAEEPTPPLRPSSSPRPTQLLEPIQPPYRTDKPVAPGGPEGGGISSSILANIVGANTLG